MYVNVSLILFVGFLGLEMFVFSAFLDWHQSSPSGSNVLNFLSRKFSILRVRASSLNAQATNIAISDDVTGSIVIDIIPTHSLWHLH